MEPLIRIQNLSFAYPDEKLALDDINVDINPGEKIALLGPNGAGKSTLIYHLNGILIGQGVVSVNGLYVKKENLPLIRATIGIVFQNPDDQLFSSTVYDDVAFGPIYQGLSKEIIHEKVNWALASVKMESYAQRNPYHLSAGEKKRIAIATVLSMLPEILVLDEPTSGLDPRSRREFIELLDELPQTMIIATHDLDLVGRLTQRTIIINNGKIVSDGPTTHVLRDKETLTGNNLL